VRDEEHLKHQIEDAKKNKREPVPAHDDCELCGRWSAHLLDGLCPSCKAKHKL